LQACRNRSGPDLALFKRSDEHAVRPASQQPRQVGLAHRERQLAEIIAVHRQHVEVVKLYLVTVLTRMRRIEIGDAIDAKDHSLAIDDELRGAVLERSLSDPGEASAPVVPTADNQPNTTPDPFDAESVTIVLDLVEPIRMVGDLRSPGRDAELKHLDKPQRQLPRFTVMTLDEVEDAGRDIPQLQITAPTQLGGNIGRDIQ
jgi:hypothetical protein